MAHLTKSKKDYLIIRSFDFYLISNLDSLSLILRRIDLSKCTRYFILSTIDDADVAAVSTVTEKRAMF